MENGGGGYRPSAVMNGPGSTRSMQRRSPGAEPGPPPNIPARSISPAIGVGTNSGVAPRSSAAGRSIQSAGGGSRRNNSSGSTAVPLSQIEKSVTHLLVATKQLLETLTQWSRGQATDAQVSDVYVRLGYEFNMACRAFTAINVDTSDLGNVPELLRNILESTLSQEASVESLEKYLPKIRDIIINLLHGLKRKQQKLRQKQARDRENGVADSGAGSAVPPGRTTSTSTMGSTNSGLTNMLNEGIEAGYQNGRPEDARNSASPTRRYVAPREQLRASTTSGESSMSSATLQSIPILPPYPGDEISAIAGGPSMGNLSELGDFPPPPPPPKQQSALAALQRGGDLERRASRRYSAYQISKHLGAPGAGIPMLPQTTPIPNRGRGEMRESMRAMQARESVRHKREASNQSRMGGWSRPPCGSRAGFANSPEERFLRPSATLNGPVADAYPILDGDEEEAAKPVKAPSKAPAKPQAALPPATKELTLFLQYRSKVKKFVLPEGYDDLSIGRLQLAFIEKFSWNTQLNGADLPDIYIQDPVSGVRHELEELSDIKDRTVLVLNVEPLDEVKKHIDEGIGSLKKMVEEVKQSMDDQGSALQRVSERQQETAKDLARLAATPPTPPADSPRTAGPAGLRKFNPSQVTEINNLRRDLAVLRQTYSNFQSEVEGSMAALRTKAGNVKMAAAKVAVPGLDGGDGGHSYVTTGRKQLNTDSDRLVAKVDDLQDLVEDLRKDVVLRGVRPLPRQLEHVTKDITQLANELKRMEDYMKREKPIWTKIWEKELEDVCQGRDELRVMEDLMVDLRDDLEKASETFALVEQATKEQMKDIGTGGGAQMGRQFSKGLNHITNNVGIDPNAAKEGVLGEVRALQPNHEDRLEAIARAEKLRQKDLESRQGNPLTKELTDFVGEGKLKKSGGFEEVERARKAKDDRIRREVWERQNGIVSAEPEPEPAAEGDEAATNGEGAAGEVGA
ncbi:actin interacting protein 3-domain-containing protein [Schizothecium vesticola]|uniref:Actin interacting protein 3-domain-containing protein n=1 Tax=Schizothecium vesticola TaxID=314040 RepID=A0AA40BTM6_9PEZI|nr:actin interacting protein 3-domain-containing protein [Schizothecium vesticola]